MAFGSDRQMYDVDLTCAQCGAHISQLPFQPSGDRPVYCSDCNRTYRQNRTGGSSRAPMSRGPRRMFDVNLTCAKCNTPITQLPFQPSGDKPVYCKTCLMDMRSQQTA